MTQWQKLVKAFAVVFAVFLIISIIGGIVSSLSVLGYVFNIKTDRATVSEEVLSRQPLSDIYELEVELANYALIIEQGDTLSVAYDDRNKRVTVEDNRLIITEKKKLLYGQEGYVVILTVPKDYIFTDVSITMGAGRLDIDYLNTNALNLELGAGNVDITNLTAITSVDIEGGAGDLSITDSEITDLDLAVGIGECDLSATLIGDNDIECGVGDADITLNSSADSGYTVSVDKGIGDVTFNGQSIENGAVVGFGSNKVDISCGIGDVTINTLNK